MAFVPQLLAPRPGTGRRSASPRVAPRCAADAGPSDAPCAPGPVPRRAALAAAVAAMGSAAVLWTQPGDRAEALSLKRMLAKAAPPVELDNGLSYQDISVGKGNVPTDGDQCAIHYSLYYNDLEIESSRESQGLAASPIGFTFGATSGPGSIIPALMLGTAGMKVGGVRLVTAPPELAFGSRGRKPLVPADATVQFAIQLMSVKPAGRNPNVNYSGSSMF